MRETKNVIVLFAFYDRTGIENYLEKQAQDGWLLEKMSQVTWKFKKVKPMKVRFSVVYFSKASAFDPEPSEGQVRFQEFCEHTGWVLAASHAQMQVFYSTQEEPLPIETDANIEIQNINSAVMKSHLPMWIIYIINGMLQIGLCIMNFFKNPIVAMSSNLDLLACVCWVTMLALTVVDIAIYVRWRRKAKVLARTTGELLDTPKYSFLMPIVLIIAFTGIGLLLVNMGGNSMIICTIGIVVVVFALTGVILLVMQLMKNMKVSANVNRAITITILLALCILLLMLGGRGLFEMVSSIRDKERPYEVYAYKDFTRKAYKDEIPLHVRDLMDSDYDKYSTVCNEKESVLLGYLAAKEEPRIDALSEPELEYTVVDVKASVLYDLCLDYIIKDVLNDYGTPEPYQPDYAKIVESDATVWGAGKAYQFTYCDELQGRYILCYDSRIVEIKFDYDWEVTKEQKAKVGKVLGK